MNLENDPIAKKVNEEMKSLRSKGVQLEGGSQYNRVFEAFYKLHQEIEQLKQTDNATKIPLQG